MKNSFILMMLLLALSAYGQRVFYKSGGTEGVILDQKQSSGIHKATKNDRKSIYKEDVDFLHPNAGIMHSRNPKVYGQGTRKDTAYVFCKRLDKGFNSVKVSFNTLGVTDIDEIPDIWFVVDTVSTNHILRIYRSKSYLKSRMVGLDYFKDMTEPDIRLFFITHFVYMVLEHNLKDDPVKCFEIGPAIMGIE